VVVVVLRPVTWSLPWFGAVGCGFFFYWLPQCPSYVDDIHRVGLDIEIGSGKSDDFLPMSPDTSWWKGSTED
jgi:hypothetical protein